MPSKDYYSTLGIPRTATPDEIKKAYRKLAMKHHPDKNKGDKTSEKKFKEINEAYETLSDTTKRKQYDTFGSADPMSDMGGGSHTHSRGGSGPEFAGFEDIFSSFGQGGQWKSARTSQSQGFSFDFSDIFGQMNTQSARPQPPQEPASLDIEEHREVPIIDLLLGCRMVIPTRDGAQLTLRIPECTRPGTRFRVAGKGNTAGGAKGDLYIVVDASMPKKLSDEARQRLSDLHGKL